MQVPASTETISPSTDLQGFLDHKAISNPEQTAVKLLKYEGETQELVGIHSSVKKAFYVNHISSVIIAVPLSEGTLKPNGLIVAKLTDPDNVDVWVGKFNVSLGWIHPRYR